MLLHVCFLSRIVSASLHEARQYHPWVMSKGLCPRSWVSANQARAARAKILVYIQEAHASPPTPLCNQGMAANPNIDHEAIFRQGQFSINNIDA